MVGVGILHLLWRRAAIIADIGVDTTGTNAAGADTTGTNTTGGAETIVGESHLDGVEETRGGNTTETSRLDCRVIPAIIPAIMTGATSGRPLTHYLEQPLTHCLERPLTQYQELWTALGGNERLKQAVWSKHLIGFPKGRRQAVFLFVAMHESGIGP